MARKAEAEAQTAKGPGTWSPRVRAWARGDGRFPITVFLWSRAAYLLASQLGLDSVPMLFYHPEARFKPLQPHPWLDGLCRWDCGWFRKIVEEGYTVAENAKVFPLFPLMGWGLEKVTGIHHVLWFILIAN